jgi:hypothetical protein
MKVIGVTIPANPTSIVSRRRWRIAILLGLGVVVNYFDPCKPDHLERRICARIWDVGRNIRPARWGKATTLASINMFMDLENKHPRNSIIKMIRRHIPRLLFGISTRSTSLRLCTDISGNAAHQATIHDLKKSLDN